MNEASDQLQRFLRAAHRRWVVWRAIEQMGICVLAGSALAVPLIGVLWLREQSSIPLVLIILGASALVGGVIGFVRRPSLLDTAIEADRQLELHDLLGSALALPNCQYLDDSWRSTIQQLAEARCRSISRSQLVLRRLGSRTWGGIGLSAALVLTLGLMTTAPLSTSARTGVRSQANAFDLSSTAAMAPQPDSVDVRREAQSNRARPSQSRDESRSVSDAEADRSADETGANDQASPATPDNDGHGSAASQTKPKAQFIPQLSQIDPVDHSSAAGSPDTDSVSGGSSAKETAASDRDDPAPRTGTTDRGPQRIVLPWRSNTWERDRAAMQALRSGQVPDRYRDLVREYFDPERD